MSWHYGVVETETADGGIEYACHELYDIDGQKLWTETPVDFVGQSIEGLADALRQASQDVERALLESRKEDYLVTVAEVRAAADG